jgi:hypothetical protein
VSVRVQRFALFFPLSLFLFTPATVRLHRHPSISSVFLFFFPSLSLFSPLSPSGTSFALSAVAVYVRSLQLISVSSCHKKRNNFCLLLSPSVSSLCFFLSASNRRAHSLTLSLS